MVTNWLQQHHRVIRCRIRHVTVSHRDRKYTIRGTVRVAAFFVANQNTTRTCVRCLPNGHYVQGGVVQRHKACSTRAQLDVVNRRISNVIRNRTHQRRWRINIVSASRITIRTHNVIFISYQISRIIHRHTGISYRDRVRIKLFITVSVR